VPARQSLQSIWRRRRFVLRCVVACVAGAALLALIADRSYESRTQFLVSTASAGEDIGAAYEGELFSQQRVATYAQIVTSPQLLEDVARELGRPGGARALEGRVTASVVPETSLIDVTASSGTAAEAKAIADALGSALPRFVEALERPQAGAASPVRLAVTRAAELPAAPASPGIALYLALGLVVGLAVAAAGIALASAFEDRPDSAEAIERLAGAPVVGTVAEHEDQAGPPVLLEDPRSPRAEDYRRLRTQLHARWGDAALSTLAVTSLGPGDANGSVAANLAIAVARGGRRVALLDANPVGSRPSDPFGLAGAPGLADVLAGEIAPAAALMRVSELPLAAMGAGTPRHGAADVLGSPRLPAVIATLREHADVVIVDAPPRQPGVAAPALAAVASAVLLVVRADAAAAWALESVARALAWPSGPLLGIVVNRRAPGRSRHGRDDAAAYAPPRVARPAADGATHAAGRS
jgi:capsular polysaccharide biosynthesis protein